MAGSNGNGNGQDTSSVAGNQFISGLIKDTDDSFVPPGSWSHARNASKVTANGSLNTLSNEASNFLCSAASYTIIGAIHLDEDRWAIYSTDNINSEIGLFDDSDCSYRIVVSDPCGNDIINRSLVSKGYTTLSRVNTVVLNIGGATFPEGFPEDYSGTVTVNGIVIAFFAGLFNTVDELIQAITDSINANSPSTGITATNNLDGTITLTSSSVSFSIASANITVNNYYIYDTASFDLQEGKSLAVTTAGLNVVAYNTPSVTYNLPGTIVAYQGDDTITPVWTSGSVVQFPEGIRTTPVHEMIYRQSDNFIYAVCFNAVFRINPATGVLTVLANPLHPFVNNNYICEGGILSPVDDHIYFTLASGGTSVAVFKISPAGGISLVGPNTALTQYHSQFSVTVDLTGDLYLYSRLSPGGGIGVPAAVIRIQNPSTVTPTITEIPVPNTTGGQYIQAITTYPGVAAADTRIFNIVGQRIDVINPNGNTVQTEYFDGTSSNFDIGTAIFNAVYYSNNFDLTLLGTDGGYIHLVQWTGTGFILLQTFTNTDTQNGQLCKFQDNLTTIDGGSIMFMGRSAVSADDYGIIKKVAEIDINGILGPVIPGETVEDVFRETRVSPIPCLNFNTNYLIKGIAKENHDCTWQTYFADNLSPDRTVNIDRPQFIQNCEIVDGCNICTNTCQIDCEAILLASLVDSPCITVNKSRTGGTLLNGSYFVVIAYTINDQKVTDYFPPSNVQSLFTHANAGGSLDITFSGLDTEHFSEFELVIIRTVNQQASAKRIGIYSTHTKEIFIDNINEALTTVPIEQIPIRNPVFEKSEAIYSVGDYAIRVAPTGKFDFNYQPLANRITCKWQSVEYPADYYRKGGNKPSYLRDEIYPFFIRWLYDTGDRGSSYHIPGRPPRVYIDPVSGINYGMEDVLNTGPILDRIVQDEFLFETLNTASGTGAPNTVLPDGGIVIAEGDMAYWQSTEIYPDNRPDIWNSSFYPWTDLPGGQDLCGKPIRHHKMPDNLTPAGSILHPDACAHIDAGANHIRIIGVKFDNIRPPLDNLGNPIPGIAGYEILRGSREGNKTVIAKGILNNMRSYNTVLHPFPQSPDGLYQNYPYNFQGTDLTLVRTESSGGFTVIPQPPPLGPELVRRDIFTFHSPDTQFKHPFLSNNELKLYGDTTASIEGRFESMPRHPREKLMGNLGFIVAALVGIGEAILAMRGQRTIRKSTPVGLGIGLKQEDYTVPTMTGQSNQTSYDVPILEAPDDDVQGQQIQIDVNDAIDAANIANNTGNGLGNFSSLLLGNDTADSNTDTEIKDYNFNPGVNPGTWNYQTEESPYSRSTGIAGIFGGIIIASHYWALGTDTALRLIEAIIPHEQYAFRYISHGFYSNITGQFTLPGFRRYSITDEQYLESHRQSFAGAEVNNLYRSEAVILAIPATKPIPPFSLLLPPDDSLTTIGADTTAHAPSRTFPSSSTSQYGALIQRFRNQYGQLDSIQQLNIGCKFTVDPNLVEQHTDTLFGGDTYITRYTEKNTFFYFYDWLIDQPDGFEFDYRTRYMLTYPRYWADFTKYEVADFLSGLVPSFFGGAGFLSELPTSKAALDAPLGGNYTFFQFLASIVQFRVKPGYFYIAQSGVRDFFVESEVNTDQRDWGEDVSERHFDPYNYAALEPLFEPRILKVGNYYKYDYSLSVSRLFINFISWGNLQPRYYDPLVAETCYVTKPKRLIYSLPQNLENTKDYWKVWLANNYKDFYSRVSVIKPIAKNGAIILFNSDSPVLFQGVDELKSSLGTKITLGDGELFSQAQQAIVNVDVSYEYGSCQDRLSVVNTPFGLYYMCTNQGKIFRATDRLDDITYHGLKFWFKEYLPSWLLKDFPTFDVLDNPVAGIGCQAIYDNQTETIYFCKRDYKLKDQYKGMVTYSGAGIFSYTSPEGPVIDVSLGDPIYFQDASFTVSFDPKSEKGGWVSFHDWHPNLNIPSKNNFLTIVDNQLWRHNQRRDSFCNYYGTDYEFSLEWIAPTQITVNTLRSIEYYLECYKYAPGRLDRYQLLDYNFDHAVIYNAEQVSGMLDLKITPKNDAFGSLGYPKLTLQPSFEVLYSKEEQKYRINQGIFDITDDRGEFSQAQRMIWVTEPNGYIRTLNPLNMNYLKNQMERKKFRSYLTKIILSKKVSGPVNMTMKTSVEKLLLSPR